MIGRVLLGIATIGVGILTVIYAYPLEKMFGRIGWAEKNIGSTKDLYVLLGCGIMLLGVLVLFGVLNFSSGTANTVSGIS